MALAERTWKARQLRQKARQLLNDGHRDIDFSAHFIPVGRGAEGLEDSFRVGGPWVSATDGLDVWAGGELDTLIRQWAGPRNENKSATYYFGEAQRDPLMFGEDPKIRRYVCVGSMGSGKTEILARWLVRMAFKFRNVMIGVFAPTGDRRRIIYKKVRKLLLPEWIADIRTTVGEVELHNGVVFKFVALKEYSKEVGSPAAGLDLVAAGIDEEQDCPQDGLDEVEMRGREAADGYFPVLSTCTLKDTPAWRERKQLYEARDDCIVQRMLLVDNPFVALAYIDGLRKSLSPRAYRLRVEARDAAPERAIYPDFSRGTHLRPRPRLGPRDVTEQIVGKPFLLGHDPGTLHHVTLFLKAWMLPGMERHTWWVLGEITSDGARVSAHIDAVTKWLHDWSGAKPEDCLVVADPYTASTQDKERPDVSIYKRWLKKTYKIRPAAYSKNIRGPSKPGVVPKKAGIEVVNSLIATESGDTWLYIDTTDQGLPCAKKLVGALEMAEYNEAGEPETERKDRYDLSHWPAALRYALFPWEKVRLGAVNYQQVG